MSERLNLGALSQQLGIKLKKSDRDDFSGESIQPQESQLKTVSIAKVEEDSQPKETNPLFKMFLLSLMIVSTVGTGIVTMLWGAGSNNQQAKKTESLPIKQPTTPEQQKELADLKASMAMEKQKLDASRLTTVKNPTPAPTPAAANTTEPTQVAAQPTKQQALTPKPVAKMQPSPQDAAQLAAFERAKQQETSALASLRQSRQQEESQLSSLRQLRERSKNQLVALNQLEQRQTAELRGLTDRLKQERQNLAAFKQQRNSPKIAKADFPLPVKVAQRQTSAANYRPTPELSYEQALALASYGGTPELDLANKQAQQSVNPIDSTLAASPILRLPVGQVVGGKLVTPFYTLISNGDGQQTNQKGSATVTIDKAIEVGSGWHLPVGTAIDFDFQVADNGMIQAISQKVTYDNTEISIPPGSFTIAGNDNQPVFAQIKEVNNDKLASADLRSAIFGGAAEVGNVLTSSGNSSTVSIGAGTTIATTNNGNPNIAGAIFKGAFSPLAQTQVTRSQTLATKLDKQSKVGYLTPGTTMRVYVAVAAAFQIPTENSSAQASSPFQTGERYAPVPKVARNEPSLSSPETVIAPPPPPPMTDRPTPSSVLMPSQSPTRPTLSNPYNLNRSKY